MDSRSLDFADQIRAATAGRGVDLVLNSLAGEAIPKSLSVLAPHGRFIEIGKRDIYDDRPIGLYPFRKNLSFFAVDLDSAFRDRTALLGRLFRQLVREFEAGKLTPLPHRVFAPADISAAFRTMDLMIG